MIIRVQTPTGTSRVEVADSATSNDLFLAISKALSVAEDFALVCGTKELVPSKKETLASLNFKNGEQVRLTLRSAAAAAASAGEQATAQQLVMDDVDIARSRQTGRIARQRDPQMCRHGVHDKCINCTDIDPFDMEMVEKALGRPIKFLSFHAHLQKLNSGADRGKLTRLEPLQCQIKPCDLHPPYPEGICTKCQPSAIQLGRPTFRMIDYVEFESAALIDSFIQAWRDSGRQRIGYMYGRYQEYDYVPLGIKSEVSAIYEPRQVGTSDGIELLDDPDLEAVDALARSLGLVRVGVIFTDICVDAAGAIVCTRYANPEPTTPMFSAQEIMLAATLQLQHRNVVPFKYTPSCQYGSKLATVIVHGDGAGQIHLSAYQATPETMAMVDADILRPAREPGLMAVLESSRDKYVPEVFYFETDKHKNQIKIPARPTIPVEFLFTDLASGSSSDPSARVFEGPGVGFPRGNRAALGQVQTLQTLARHFAQDGSFLSKVSDFNLLVYLATSEETSFLRGDLPELYAAIQARDDKRAAEWAKRPNWKTLQLLFNEANGGVAKAGGASSTASKASSSAPAPSSASSAASRASGKGKAPAAAASGGSWACSVCTFINESSARTVCEVCQSPRS